MRLIDISGQKFGRLTVTGRSSEKRARPMWNCECDCGGSAVTDSTSLRSGHTNSCGCYRLEQNILAATIHGGSRRRNRSGSYKIWCGMIARCYCVTNSAFENYGGRGISVCESWRKSYANFIADMGEPAEGLSIDRINNEIGYEPGNCKWSTASEQNNNTRSNVIITTASGQMTAAQFARSIGMKAPTLRAAIKRGETIIRGIKFKSHKRGDAV